MSNIVPPRTTPWLREIDRIRKTWPAEFNDGLVCALGKRPPGPRDPGGYPLGFHDWPIERRNAWWAGSNFAIVAENFDGR